MGNSRKVWLACGAAMGLPLSGLAQNVRQVQVTETEGRVEIHVMGANLPKPTNVTWQKDVAYTLEWQAGLQSPGGRIRVESGDVKSVWYGWFKAHPRTMRVRIQSNKHVEPVVKQDADGWVISIGGKPDVMAKKHSVSKPTPSNDTLMADMQGESDGKSIVKVVSVSPAPHSDLPVEKPHDRVTVIAPATPAQTVIAKPLLESGTVVQMSPALEKWSTLEKLDKAQVKKIVAKPSALVAELSGTTPVVPVDLGKQQPHQFRRVTLDCSNADLAQVLKGLAMQSGANIVIGPGVNGKVTADLHDVTIEQALKYISYLTGVKYEVNDGIYMFGVVPTQVHVDVTQATPSVVKVIPILSDSQAEVKQVLDAKFKGEDLQVMTPADAKRNPSQNPNAPSTQSVVNSEGDSKSLVMPESFLILVGPQDVIDQAAEVAKSVDEEIMHAHASYQRTDRIDRELVAYDVKFADPRALREALISQIPGLRAVIAPNSVGASQLYHEGVARRQSNEDNAGVTGNNGGAAGTNAAATGSEGNAQSVSVQQTSDTTLEAPFSKEENVSVPMKLVLRGTHEQILQAREYLKMLDTPPHQVALELRVMELTKTDALNAGIDWSVLTGGAVKVLNLNNSVTGTINNSASVSLSGKNFNGDVTASLDALAEKNKLLARPNMVCMDGRQSEIFIGDIIRYIESITASQNGTTVTTGEVPVGVRLSVLPRIGADGNMTLDLRPRISLLTSFTPVPGGGELPQTSSRFAQSTVSMQSGQTLAIGGLIQDQDVKTLSGIPILMNLPIIGNFFRSTTINKERTELVIFLTARAINGPVGSESLPMQKDMHFGGALGN